MAYDQAGNQDQAKVAYEHALILKPGEPSVLNNYALSRLLAKDTDMARTLAARAEIANATAQDEKITRNIAMIRSMEPAAGADVAANKPAIAAGKPAPVAQNFTPAPQQPLPHPVSQPPAPKVTQAALPAPVSTPAQGGVVMQRVPVDPLAGPVASHAPRPLQRAVKTETLKSDIAKTEAPKIPAKPEPAKALPAKPAEPAKAQVKLETPAKPKAEIAVAKPDAARPVVKLDLAAKTETAKSVPAVKPAAEPKVLASTPVKATKPANAKADPKADSKAAIPGLRLSANAY